MNCPKSEYMQLIDPKSAYVKAETGGSMRLQIEWLDMHLLAQNAFTLVDALHYVHKQQMR